MFSKKPTQIVNIGIATTTDIINELIYQIFIFLNSIFHITLIVIFKKLPLLPREVNTSSETNLRERLQELILKTLLQTVDYLEFYYLDKYSIQFSGVVSS